MSKSTKMYYFFPISIILLNRQKVKSYYLLYMTIENPENYAFLSSSRSSLKTDCIK